MNLKDILKKWFPDKAKEIDEITLDDPADKDLEKRLKELEAKKAEIDKLMKYIEDQKTEAEKKNQKKSDNPEIEELKGMIAQMQKANDTLTSQLKAVADANQSTEAVRKKEQVAAALAKAKKEMKIPGDNKEVEAKWQKILEADLESGTAALDAMTPIAKSAAPKSTPSGQGGAGNTSNPIEANDYVKNQSQYLQAAKEAFSANKN